MVEEIGPWASPIFCPVLTLSPTLTTGLAGAPVCWDRGMTTFLGRDNSWIGSKEVIFSSGGWTPPRKVLILIFYSLFVLISAKSVSDGADRRVFCVFSVKFCALAVAIRGSASSNIFFQFQGVSPVSLRGDHQRT
jgi:hypothetical protein